MAFALFKVSGGCVTVGHQGGGGGTHIGAVQTAVKTWSDG